jgi:hypothetical protein
MKGGPSTLNCPNPRSIENLGKRNQPPQAPKPSKIYHALLHVHNPFPASANQVHILEGILSGYSTIFLALVNMYFTTTALGFLSPPVLAITRSNHLHVLSARAVRQVHFKTVYAL